jgi:peptidoglycan/xylan/chitin deacetylase (PgdA/CDA1 family)
MYEVGLPFVFKSFWPKGAKMCCVITHDVDWFVYSPFHKAVLQGPLGLGGLPRLVFDYLARADLGWNIPAILELNSSYGAKSSFFFQTEYDVLDGYLERSVKMLQNQGYPVGLHASHNAYASEESLRAEIDLFTRKTGSRPDGIRHHIYKFNIPETWRIESAVGFDFDATFSYNRFFGFRGEVCYPYHPFAGSPLPLMELPTSFMDWTALHKGRRGKDMRSTISSIMASVERYNGVFVSNFHNTYVNPHTFPDVVDAYRGILEEASSKKYWVATAQDCVRWWRRRSSERPNPVLASDGGVRVESAEVPLIAETQGAQELATVEMGS